MSSTAKRISAVVLLAILLTALSVVNLPVWAVAPGKAQEVSGLISIKGTPPSNRAGHILMTDVTIGPVSCLEWLVDKTNPNIQLVPSSAILGNAPPSSFIPTGLDQMKQSKQAATIAALSYLGYDVHEVKGAIVAGLAKDSLVSSQLKIGDLITKVNSRPVGSAGQFASIVSKFQPGNTAELTYIPASVVADRPNSGAYRSVSVKFGSRPGSPSKPYLGIEIGNGVSYRSPVSVSISTPGIGGPSAGLAFTLGIIDRLRGGGLTLGNTIAATGTISPAGTVGDVGGVPQKTIAVERAGARLFLVPPQEYKAALSKATPRLKVEAVSTLKEAISDVEAFAASVKRPGS